MNNLNRLDNRSLFPFFIGATAENIIRQPLTAISVVMINQHKNLRNATYGLYSAGGIGRFYNGYQGFLISWCMRSSHRISTFGANQAMHESGYSNASIALATTVAEFATTALGELILTVAQHPAEAKRSAIDLVKERYRSEGFTALTTGFLDNSLRNIIFNGVLFGLKNNRSSQIEKYPLSMSAAITLTAVVASHPLEVIRSRKVKDSHLSYRQIAHNIFLESSSRGFFKGLIPRIASVGVGTFVTLVIVNELINKESYKTKHFSINRQQSKHAM